MEVLRLTVDLPQSRSYDIRVGHRILTNLGVHLAALDAPRRLFVLADGQAARFHLDKLERGLAGEDFSYSVLIIPSEGDVKTPDQAIKVWQWLLEQGCDRHCALLAFGGGRVCDLAGFVASTWMRGIPCIQVPTTLLAMVDASVGGKTALDLPGARNAVGTFHQPFYVALDLEVLSTLETLQFRSGLAEMAKMALLAGDDASLDLVQAAPALLAGDEGALQAQVHAALSFKARVVEQDERDQGIRACLNYGHTLGHALESLCGPSVLTHGQAVAEGMRFAGQLSQVLLDADPAFLQAQGSMLDSLGLEALGPGILPPGAGASGLLAAMGHDKKAQDGQVRFILLTEPGAWQQVEVPGDVLERELGTWMESRA